MALANPASTVPESDSVPSITPPILDLRDLWRCKWFIGLCTLACVGLGGVYLAITPQTYEVSSRVMVREDQAPFQQQHPSYVDREFLATQAEIIHSPLIIREALDSVSVQLPDGFNDGPVAYVLESLTVMPIVQTDVLKISIRSQDAAEAKALTAALIDEYEQHVQEADHGRTAGELELLTRREVELRRQLEEFQDEYSEFRRRSPMIGQGRETLTVQADQLAHLGRRLSEARNRTLELTNKLEAHRSGQFGRQVDSDDLALSPVALFNANSFDRRETIERRFAGLDNDPSTNVLRDASNAEGADFTEIQNQLWQARALRQEMASKFALDHPNTIATTERVRYWEDLLEGRVRAAVMGLTQELESAKTTEASLTQMYEDEKARVKQLNDYMAEETALVNKINRTEEIYSATLARFKEIQLTEKALEGGRSSVVVRVLDGADLQEEVVWPMPEVLLGLCGILGMTVGVVLVSLRRI